MKMKYVAITLIMQAMSAMSQAAWELDSDASHLSFITTKKDNISEVQAFTGLKGSISNTMNARVLIDTNTVSTQIDLRDDRIRSLLLNSDILPNIYIRTQLPDDLISNMTSGSAAIYPLKTILELHGIRKPIQNRVLVTKTDSNITVSSLKPIVINSEDYAMSGGIEALRTIASLSSITTQVPVSFHLSYQYTDTANTSIPFKPQSATASVSVDGAEATVNWSGDDVSYYLVQYRIDGGYWQLAGIAAGNYRTLTFSPTSNGNMDVRLISIKDGRSSNTSTIASATITEVDDGTGTPPDLSNGAKLWAEHGCASCHGNDGKGNTPIIGALNRPNLQEYIVENMPYGSPTLCGADCSGDIIDWMRDTFEPSDNTPITPPNLDTNGILESLSQSKARELLYKTSLNILGRIPTEQEYSALSNKGNLHLSKIIDTQLEDEQFIERVKVIFNDLLLTQQWDEKDGFHSYLRNYSWQSFENADAEWIKEHQGIPYYTTIRRYISNGHSRSPLELISHVIKNDKPFSEILTADYAMLNWYAAKSFSLEGTVEFRDLPYEEQKNKDFPKDPHHFMPVQLPKVPSAGLLTTGVYMQKYRTTSTNRNRNRAYTFFKNFLDTDILAIGGERPGDSESSHEYPTMTDPNCIACHQIMDPVASSFKHWISFAGMGRPFYDKTPRTNEWDSSHILPAGFNGNETPAGVDPLPWLAAKSVQDPRFSKAMVKAVFRDMTGVGFIPATVNGIDFQSPAYLEQQAFIDAVAKQFRANNLNFKAMIKTLLISEYALGQHNSPMEDLLMTPQRLNKKIRATLGRNWENWLGTWNVLYGGINSDSVTVRNQSVNGLITTIQLRMAEDMACAVTAKEFSVPAGERLLLGGTEPNILPDTSTNTTKIKQTIIAIYERLIGKKLDANDETIVAAFDVYESALSLGKSGIDSGSIPTRIAGGCGVTRRQAEVNEDFVFEDKDYYTRAWQAVIQFILMDPRYFYL